MSLLEKQLLMVQKLRESTAMLEGHFLTSKSLSKFMVRSGYAFAFRKYKASEKFIDDEEYAKYKKLGMWAMEFEYPWDLR